MFTNNNPSRRTPALDTDEAVTLLATLLEAEGVTLEPRARSEAELETIRHREAAEERRRHRIPQRINSVEQCEETLPDFSEDLEWLELWQKELARWGEDLALSVRETKNQTWPDPQQKAQKLLQLDAELQRLYWETQHWKLGRDQLKQDPHPVKSYLARRNFRKDFLRQVHVLSVILIVAVFLGRFAETSYFPDVNCSVGALLRIYDIEKDSCFTNISRLERLWNFTPWIPDRFLLILP